MKNYWEGRTIYGILDFNKKEWENFNSNWDALMDRFDAGFESTYCCMHKLVIYVLNDPVEIKLLRNITQNSPNKENVFFFFFFRHWPNVTSYQ